ncbi:MAG TPA: GNAT family N-acetyltransferase [Nocardioidaceae bacterium]|nr:GNAT family N-acetyltransferase [Nocardioidaceae bacterium]
MPDARLLLVEARTDGRLTAVLPLVETSRGWPGLRVRQLQGAANIHSCRFDITCEKGPAGEAAVAAIWAALRGIPGWDLIEIPRVPQGGAAEALVAQAEKDGYPTGFWRGFWQSIESPYAAVDLPPGADAVTVAGNAHFRRNVKRRLRRAMEEYDVRLRRLDEADPAALEAFFDLERRSWKGTAGTAIACSDGTREFYSDVARQAAEHGYLALYFLDFDGIPVAAHLGLRHNGRYYLPKIAYDEDYARFSPGQLLMRAIIEDVSKDGPAVIDFLGLMAPWKADWTENVLPHSSCFIFQTGLRGRLLHLGRFSVLSAARTAAHHPSLEPAAKALQQWRKPSLSPQAWRQSKLGSPAVSEGVVE